MSIGDLISCTFPSITKGINQESHGLSRGTPGLNHAIKTLLCLPPTQFCQNSFIVNKRVK
jgi:hypothetical protein